MGMRAWVHPRHAAKQLSRVATCRYVSLRTIQHVAFVFGLTPVEHDLMGQSRAARRTAGDGPEGEAGDHKA